MLEKYGELETARERNAALRAALIASEIHNAHTADSRGRRRFYRDSVEPSDYIRQPVQYVDGSTLIGLVRGWIGKGRKQ